MKLIYKIQITFFCFFISSMLLCELSIKAGYDFVSILPYPQFYSNVLGPFKPNIAVPAYWNPKLRYKYSTSQDGFRNNESRSSSATAKSVLCLGDSYTFGMGVNNNETYPSYLENLLNAGGNQAFRVLNAGAMDIGIKHYVAYYRDNIDRLKSDLVIVQFNVYDLQIIRHKVLIRQKSYDTLKDFGNRDGLQLFFAAFVFSGPFYDFLNSTPNFPNLKPQVPDILATIPAENKILLDESNNAKTALLWNEYYKNLLELNALVKSNGSRLLVVIVPDRDQINDYKNGPSAALVPFCNKNGIACLDMTQDFREYFIRNNVSPYLEPLDIHCTRDGNSLIAKKIYEHISNGWQAEKSYFDGGVPCRIEGTFSENGELELNENEFVRIAKNAVQDVAIKSIAGGGITFVTSKSELDSGAQAKITFELLSRIRKLAFVLFPHREQDGGGDDFSAVVRIMNKEWRFSTADTNDRAIWRGIDIPIAIECVNENSDNTTVELDLHFARNTGLVTDKKHGSGAQRRFEMVVYPEE